MSTESDTIKSEAEWTGLSMMADEIKPLCYEGMVLKGIVTEVIDGDTLQLVVVRDDNYESHRLRLIGVNAPDEQKEEEKELAIKSKQALINKLKEHQNFVTVHFEKDDRYGRRTGVLILRNNESLNEWVIKNGYAQAESKASTINRSLTVTMPVIVDNSIRRMNTIKEEEDVPMYTARELVKTEEVKEVKEDAAPSSVTL